MTFPSTHIKTTNIDMTPALAKLLDQKLEPLEKFLPLDDADFKCDIELERSTEHQSGKIYRAEINVYVDGVMHRAEATEEQIEKAIDEMRDEIKRELRKANDKKASLKKKGGQELKRLIQENGSLE